MKNSILLALGLVSVMAGSASAQIAPDYSKYREGDTIVTCDSRISSIGQISIIKDDLEGSMAVYAGSSRRKAIRADLSDLDQGEIPLPRVYTSSGYKCLLTHENFKSWGVSCEDECGGFWSAASCEVK